MSSASVAIAASWSPAATASANGCIERLVHQLVCELVVRALHMAILDGTELPRNTVRLDEEVAQRLVLHAVLAAHLLHHQLRVRDDLQRRDLQLRRPLEPRDQAEIG